MLPKDTILKGNCVDLIPTLPDNSIDLTVTSPPYYNKRNYGHESIWNAAPNCDHQFIEIRTPNPNSSGGHNESRMRKENPNFQEYTDYNDRATYSNYCAVCGAWKGQLGLEPTPQEYVSHLADIFDLIKPKLKNTGACWINIADSYGGSGGTGKSKPGPNSILSDDQVMALPEAHSLQGMEKKCMLGIPEMFMLEMMKRGWILRNKIIWRKTNPMPESMNDRFSNNWEYFYFFTKSSKTQFWLNERTREIVGKKPKGIKGDLDVDYFLDEFGDPITLWHGCDYFFQKILKPQQPVSAVRAYKAYNPDKRKDDQMNDYSMPKRRQDKYYKRVQNILEEGKPLLRNERGVWETQYIMYGQIVYDAFISAGVNGKTLEKVTAILLDQFDNDYGTIWDIATRAYHEKHFATYPVELLDNIMVSCCPQAICRICGLPQVRFYDSQWIHKEQSEKVKELDKSDSPQDRKGHHQDGLPHRSAYSQPKIARCKCEGHNFDPGVTLDPFAGASTTAMSAIKHGRHYIMMEISDSYIAQSERRINDWKGVITPDMFA